MKHTYKAIPLALTLALGLSPLTAKAETVHTVKTGDTLWAIGNTYKVRVDDLKNWNKLPNNILYIGQKLVVGATKDNADTTTTQTYTVKAGDTLSAIATKHNVTVANLKTWNALKSDTIYVGQQLRLQSTTTTTPPTSTQPTTPPTNNTTQSYTVKAGDTLYSIATQFKVTIDELKKWNNLSTTTIKVGQKLTITSATQVTPEAPTTPTTKTGIVKADALNVRSGAGTTFSLVGTLKNQAKVTILSEKSGWLQIESEAIKGWVLGDYITIQTESTPRPEEKPTTTTTLYKVDASGLNVRKDPSTGNNVIEVINKGTIVEELERKGTWSYVQYSGKKGWVSNEYLVKTEAVTNKSKTVVVDPGHGGSDPGALGAGGFNEEDANLAISLVLQRELLARGYNVAMIRTTDTACNNGTTSVTSELKCRVDKSIQAKGDIFISVHNNSATPAAIGTETYYTAGRSHSTESLRLANTVHKHYQPAFGSSDRKVKQANYYVTRENIVPSILLEVGFMTNSSDLSKLRSIAYQEKVGKAIADGVDEYFGY